MCVGVRGCACVWGGVRACVCVLNKNMFISTLINYMLDCTNFSMYRVYVCIGLTCMYACMYVCVSVCSSLYCVPQVQRVEAYCNNLDIMRDNHEASVRVSHLFRTAGPLPQRWSCVLTVWGPLTCLITIVTSLSV